MARLLLVHWHAEEAAERAARLTSAGHSVRVPDASRDPAGYKRFFAAPHEAVLIDLARQPSHGRELGGWLRRNKASRAIPLIYIAGDPEKTERTHALLFARNAAELAKRWPAATRAVSEGGRLWICWPKAASGTQTDLSETGVRAYGMDRGWVDFKVAAVDATWSGLAFARREAGASGRKT